MHLVQISLAVIVLFIVGCSKKYQGDYLVESLVVNGVDKTGQVRVRNMAIDEKGQYLYFPALFGQGERRRYTITGSNDERLVFNTDNGILYVACIDDECCSLEVLSENGNYKMTLRYNGDYPNYGKTRGCDR